MFANCTFGFAVRIDIECGRIMNIRRLSIEDIEADLQRLYDINSQAILKHLSGILTTLNRFPIGNYMLRHFPKHENRVMVYGASTDL